MCCCRRPTTTAPSTASARPARLTGEENQNENENETPASPFTCLSSLHPDKSEEKNGARLPRQACDKIKHSFTKTGLGQNKTQPLTCPSFVSCRAASSRTRARTSRRCRSSCRGSSVKNTHTHSPSIYLSIHSSIYPFRNSS